jgi:CheY-like chemotaxis protein
MKVLIVEDAADIRELVRYCLRAQGAIVTEATNGKEAVQQVQSHVFDLIMMDIQMPVLDGVEATQQLRQAGCQLPIVALTAHAMLGERERLLLKGFTEYLSKPIDIVQMLDIVSRYRQASGTVPPKAGSQ